MRRTLGGAALALALALAPLGASAATAEVGVRNNVFDPLRVTVQQGDTVTWRLLEGRHSVRSDTGDLFRSDVLDQPGETFSYTTPASDTTIFYHCEIHGVPGDGTSGGAGMWGVIVVGKGSPPPPDQQLEVRAVPSDDWPDVGAALLGMSEHRRYRIALAPGVHRLTTQLSRETLGIGTAGQPLDRRFEVTIAGAGATPSDVVIEGGIATSLDGLKIRDITIRNARGAGVLVWRDAQRWAVENVVVDDAGSYGVRVERGATSGRIAGVRVRDAEIAGVSIEGCTRCDVLVDGVDVQDSLQGISTLNAGSVIVRRSTLTNNGVGIAVKASPSTNEPARGGYVGENVITNSTSRARAARPSASLDLPVGAGIWLNGVAEMIVDRNTIDGASFGVVATTGSSATMITRNEMMNAVEADLAWDGVGAGVCMSENAQPGGGAPTTEPPDAQTIYSCDRPTTVGLPYPRVTAAVLAWGLDLPRP